MPSTRRTVLAGIGTAAVAALAGCSGSASSSTADCSSHNFDHAEPAVIHAASTTITDEGDVRFVVTFDADVDMERLDLISVYDATDDLAFSIPIVAGGGPEGTRRRYEQTLGARPRHGRYRVVVTDAAGETVDAVTAHAHCYRETTEA